MRKITLALLIAASSLPVLAENNFSTELLLGNADQKTGPRLRPISGDDLSIGIRGAYLLHKNMGFELAYMNYGETDDSTGVGGGGTQTLNTSTSALTLGVKGIIPFDSGFSIIGRAGMSAWDFEIKQTVTGFAGGNAKLDDDGTDLYYGIGMKYNFNEKMSFGLEYTITEMGLLISGDKLDHEVKDTALSIGYNF